MINSDNKKVTVDFIWTSPSLKDVTFHIKHHHTEEYGPTISISQDADSFYAFPAGMFAEIVDFLRSEGVMKQGDVKVKEIPQEKKSKLSVPVIENVSGGKEQEPDIAPILEVKGEPVETFFDGGSQKSSQEPQYTPGSTKVDKLASDTDAEDMALERQTAASKAKKTPGFKLSHKSKEE